MNSTVEDRRWMWNVGVLWIAELIALMGMSLVMPFLPLYLAELGVADRQAKLWAGWVGGANFLCAALVAPMWGAIADRFGRKPMAVRALLGLAVSVWFMAEVTNVYQLFGLRMLQGAFGGFVAAAIALAGASVPREKLGSALGFLQTAVIGGNLIGPQVGAELSHQFGYRATFRVTGCALIVACILVILLVREADNPNARANTPRFREGVRELLAIPKLRWMMAVVLFTQAGVMLINPQISLFLQELVSDRAHLNRAVGWVSTAPAISAFLLATVWGKWGDRRGHATVLGLALLGASLSAPWAAWSHAVWQVFLIRMAMGGFTSALNPLTNTSVAHCVTESRTAGAFSLISSAQMLGSCLGPFLSGPLAAQFGVRPLFVATSVLLAIAGCASLRAGRGDAQPAILAAT